MADFRSWANAEHCVQCDSEDGEHQEMTEDAKAKQRLAISPLIDPSACRISSGSHCRQHDRYLVPDDPKHAGDRDDAHENLLLRDERQTERAVAAQPITTSIFCF
jgi:hypothetical protein